MKRNRLVLLACINVVLLAGCWSGGDGGGADMQVPPPNTFTVNVQLSALEVIGGGAPNGTATGRFTINLDDETLSGTVTLNGLTATSVTLNRGFAGEAGLPIVTLVQDSATQWSVPGGTDFPQADQDALEAGDLHVQVSNAQFPDGALRGQLVTGDVTLHFVVLSGAQEVPSVTSVATGVASITLDPSTGDIVVHVNVAGLDDAVAGHIHQALAGATGSIIVELSQDPDDMGHWFAEDGALSADELAAYRAGALYVNLHTPSHLGGEIRGQIVPDGVEVVFTALTGDDVVPPVATDAMGIAATTIRESDATLTLHVNLVDTTASAVTVNQAPVGQNGPEVFALEQDANSLSHWLISDYPPDDAAEAALRNGGLYVLAASATQPDGELRGQIEPADVAPGPGGAFTVLAVVPSDGSKVANIPNAIDLTFNRAPLAASVDLDQFELLASGEDGSFGDGNELVVTIVSAVVSDMKISLDLTGAMDVEDVYRLRVDPDGATTLTDTSGIVLDGDGDDNPGGDFITTFTVDASANAPTFSVIQTEIFNVSCAFAGCHAPPTPQLGMDLSAGAAYANIVGVPSVQFPSLDRIEPGDPDNSYLVRKVEGTGLLARMPLNQPPLSNEKIQKLRDWAAAGAQNDAAPYP